MMKEPYLIAVDLDGTLLTENKTILSETKAVFARAREAGHYVVISTGRPYRASKQYYYELNLDTPIVNFNGAHVHHPRHENWGNFHYPLPLATAKDVIRSTEKFKVKNLIVEVRDELFIQNYDPAMMEAFSIGDPKIVVGDLDEKLQEGPTCILVQAEDQDVEAIKETLDTEHSDTIEQRSWGAPSNIIEVIREGISKRVGLKKVADFLNVPAERVIAFGDEDNDLTMLKWAGQGVAMGNAHVSVKEISDAVTATNEENGIAEYLKQHLLS